MPPTIQNICDFLDAFAPTRLAEEWDNVGLLVGDPSGVASKVMTCLTITPESVAEAIDQAADLIVTHHPLPFRPLQRLTTEQPSSRMLWELIRAGVSIYSPHTGFDSAASGINQSLAERIGLTQIKPLLARAGEPDGLGAGRIGNLAGEKLSDLLKKIRQQFQLESIRFVGHSDANVSNVAIACGSGGSFLPAAIAAGCDTFVTGEATFHSCLEAKASHVSLVLMGHYGSERFAIEMLGEKIADQFPDLNVWASARESDPISLAH